MACGKDVEDGRRGRRRQPCRYLKRGVRDARLNLHGRVLGAAEQRVVAAARGAGALLRVLLWREGRAGQRR